jgi:molybdopterin converting factor small subunit
MGIELQFFGQLTDKVGCTHLHIDNPGDVVSLQSHLFAKFPALQNAKFTIAINNKMVSDTEAIQENDKIALMPPFSGG